MMHQDSRTFLGGGQDPRSTAVDETANSRTLQYVRAASDSGDDICDGSDQFFGRFAKQASKRIRGAPYSISKSKPYLDKQRG